MADKHGHSNEGGGFFDKVKKTFNETTEKAGVELSYANRKRKGFVHAPEIEEHVNIMRAIREEIPSLRERIDSVCRHEKELAESDEKGAAEFAKQSEVITLHPHLSRIYKTWADKLASNAAARFQYQAAIDTVKEEWRQLETVDLSELQKKQDMTNKSMSDAKYWEKKNPPKSQEFDFKYRQYVSEWIVAIHELRIKKEEFIPQWILRNAQAEVLYLRASLKLAETAEQAIRMMGPPKPNPARDLSRFNPAGGGGYGSAAGYEIETDEGHAAGAPPSGAPGPAAPPRPAPSSASARVMARGVYAFNAQGPQELTFNPGDVLTILTQDGQWWTAELNGRKGLIPSNYVQLL